MLNVFDLVPNHGAVVILSQEGQDQSCRGWTLLPWSTNIIKNLVLVSIHMFSSQEKVVGPVQNHGGLTPKEKDQQETYDFGQCACSSWPETCSKVRKHVWFGPKSWCDGGNILLIQPKKKTRSILQRFGRQGRDKYMFILLRRHASLVRKLMFDLVQIQSAGVENSYLLITKCRGSGFQL